MSQAAKRLNRWTDEPVRGKDGKPRAARIAATDYPVFERFNRYRDMGTSFIVAFNNTNPVALQARLNLLSREPNRYLYRPLQQRNVPNENYKDQSYRIADKAVALMRKRGAWRDDIEPFGDSKFYPHSRMTNDAIQSLELFAPKMIWRHEIPQATNRLPVEVSCTLPNGAFASAKFDYQNDSHGPFGINYGGSARFLSLESEHHGEVDANNLERPSFLKKFLAIRYIVQHELYQTEWGLPHLLSLFVCTDQHEIDRRKAIVMRETGGKGASYVLFQVVPAVDESMHSVKPMPELYEGPWQRAGYPDFYLSQP
jgi:hypothetical protein